jgi:P-type Mg2+ transporter
MTLIDKAKILASTQEDLLSALRTSAEGLTQQEATLRLAEYGRNQLTGTGHYALRVFVRQFQSSLVYLLVAACLISVWLEDYSDAILIAIILVINTTLGFYQEFKSERIVEKLSKFISKQVLVKRDGKISLIDEANIVPGDVVKVREGDIAVADMRLIDVDNLQVNESQLTGESVPVIKQAFDRPSGDRAEQRRCFVHAGSIIEKGEGTGVVYATGNNTELGVIASLSTNIKKETQYEKSLRAFSTLLIKVTLGGLGLIFVLKLLVGHGHLTNVVDLFLFIVALAVAVVPEVLPVIATATMTSGAMKLAKQHVVVKRLSSLEDFGNVTMLCTDKTGTITENKMAIAKLASDDEQLLLTLVCASIQPVSSGKRQLHSSFDEAFINYTPKPILTRASQFKMLKELPFDPDARRRRAMVRDDQSEKHYLVVVGAPEPLLKIAKTRNQEKYTEDLTRQSKAGLRHLAIAYKEIIYSKGFDILENEHDLEFLGCAAFLDPLRPMAKDTIRQAEKLGIAIKILTGDSREVAEYVGREVGLISGTQVVYTGDELEAMPEETFKSTVKNHPVFARVSPRQKYDIIKALKDDNVVAYQGDGINDAPSLKLADVAIAVDNATDIANENADIVLLSNKLGVIIDGIKYGRTIFVNINKYVKYTLVGNWGNFIALGVLYLFSTDLPMLPIQVLLTSVVTDIPFISIYTDSVEDREVILPEKHNPKELIMLPLVLGFPTALFSLGAFYLIRNNSQIFIETVLFLFFTMLQMFAFFSVRTTGHFWQGSRPSLILSTLFLIALISSVLIIYIKPFQTWFNFISLPAFGIIAILLLMVLYLLIMDAIKREYYRASGKIRGFGRVHS